MTTNSSGDAMADINSSQEPSALVQDAADGSRGVETTQEVSTLTSTSTSASATASPPPHGDASCDASLPGGHSGALQEPSTISSAASTTSSASASCTSTFTASSIAVDVDVDHNASAAAAAVAVAATSTTQGPRAGLVAVKQEPSSLRESQFSQYDRSVGLVAGMAITTPLSRELGGASLRLDVVQPLAQYGIKLLQSKIRLHLSQTQAVDGVVESYNVASDMHVAVILEPGHEPKQLSLSALYPKHPIQGFALGKVVGKVELLALPERYANRSDIPRHRLGKELVSFAFFRLGCVCVCVCCDCIHTYRQTYIHTYMSHSTRESMCRELSIM
jgi:hypothetical protein